ncbi:hypothetical protein EOK76_g2949 [Lacticaseibacillus paracasei]|nr:hypothetical protein EOK76_g2949 [Lacticaseibacillus paracasei]
MFCLSAQHYSEQKKHPHRQSTYLELNKMEMFFDFDNIT